MILELILSWLFSLPRLTDRQARDFWRLEQAVTSAQLQCEPCQSARVDRNRKITELQAVCVAPTVLDFDKAGDPQCIIKGAHK